MQYAACFEPAEEGGFVVTFPDFSWGVTQGDNEANATEMAVDAISTRIHELIRNNEPTPESGKHRGRKIRWIRLPVLESAKTRLYREFLAAGIRKSGLANRLGFPKTNGDRLFDLRHQSRLDQIEAAFRVLGKELSIEVRNAA